MYISQREGDSRHKEQFQLPIGTNDSQTSCNKCDDNMCKNMEMDQPNVGSRDMLIIKNYCKAIIDTKMNCQKFVRYK